MQKGPLFHLKVRTSYHCAEKEEEKYKSPFQPTPIKGFQTRLERGFLEILQHLGGRISAETWRTSLWHQVAGATCYYQGDTTQRGILQILIQGSIFIDATMQRAAYHKLTELRATGICHFRVPLPLFSLSAPLASSRSQLLREYSLSSVGVGAKMGALGSLLGGLRARSHLCCSCCGQKPGMSPSSIWDARASW